MSYTVLKFIEIEEIRRLKKTTRNLINLIVQRAKCFTTDRQPFSALIAKVCFGFFRGNARAFCLVDKSLDSGLFGSDASGRHSVVKLISLRFPLSTLCPSLFACFFILIRSKPCPIRVILAVRAKCPAASVSRC